MTARGDLAFATDTELDELVGAFERQEAPAGGFSHQAHLAVALTYLDRHGLDDGLDRMRRGLLAFLEHALGDRTAARVRYKETVTAFWMRLLASELAAADPALPLHMRVNALLARHRDSGEVRTYYSRERLDSPEARTSYLEPDLRPLPLLR